MCTSASSGFRDLLVQRIALPAEQLDALEAHYELLLRWNRVLNLTSIHDVREAVERHYCEALFLAARLPPLPLRIADLGSGGGFPGFPVAIYRPDCTVTLIESHQRKAVFLREASRKVPNVRVIAQRAETVREAFDFAVSRAVSYADLVTVLGRLAPSAALLTGSEGPPDRLGFAWDEAIRLPWGSQRFLRIGRRCFT
jgi:16S rRNA (guanine(527)-N(7))-methyltransferase RsmG